MGGAANRSIGDAFLLVEFKPEFTCALPLLSRAGSSRASQSQRTVKFHALCSTVSCGSSATNANYGCVPGSTWLGCCGARRLALVSTSHLLRVILSDKLAHGIQEKHLDRRFTMPARTRPWLTKTFNAPSQVTAACSPGSYGRSGRAWQQHDRSLPFGPLSMHSPSTGHVRSGPEQSVSEQCLLATAQSVRPWLRPTPLGWLRSADQTSRAFARQTGELGHDMSFWYALPPLISLIPAGRWGVMCCATACFV
jgi:hypothetical protein